MILTQIRNRVERWLNRIVHQAIIDATFVYRYRPESDEKRPARVRREITLSDQAQLNIGRVYVVFFMAIPIALGILHQHLIAWIIWAVFLVGPLLALLIWRRRLDQ